MVKVAVFPASSEVGMEVIRCLSDHKDIEVTGVDSEPGPAKYICKNYISDAPWMGHSDIRPYFKKFEYVYPANDYALSCLTGLKNAVTHPDNTIILCGNKLSTYKFFEGKIPVPDVYPSVTWEKPQIGHSGIGQKKSVITDIRCEYLPGKEYTVDCFTQKGLLKYCQPRTRENIKGGISCRSESVLLNYEIQDIATKINTQLEFTGAWFFQVKEDRNGALKLLEIGARIAGSSGLSRAMGVNLPLLHLYDKMGIEVEMPKTDVKVIHRYLAVKADFPKVTRAYFDWDDTIMIKGKVNWRAIALAYKMGVECHILTRKENANLIPPFQSIIISQNKAQYSAQDTVLIDDSFAERRQWINSISPDMIDLYL